MLALALALFAATEPPDPTEDVAPTASALNARGVALARDGDWREALAAFDAARSAPGSAAHGPQPRELCNNRMLALVKTGRPDLAQRAFDECIDVDDRRQRAAAWFNLALADDDEPGALAASLLERPSRAARAALCALHGGGGRIAHGAAGEDRAGAADATPRLRVYRSRDAARD